MCLASHTKCPANKRFLCEREKSSGKKKKNENGITKKEDESFAFLLVFLVLCFSFFFFFFFLSSSSSSILSSVIFTHLNIVRFFFTSSRQYTLFCSILQFAHHIHSMGILSRFSLITSHILCYRIPISVWMYKAYLCWIGYGTTGTRIFHVSKYKIELFHSY